MISPFSVGEVAWYGATVATLTLAFNVWKYARERARLQIRIVRTWYEDGGYEKVEKTEHGESAMPNIYFHIEIANIGERPTTILGVEATTKQTGLDWWRYRNARFKGVLGYAGGAFKAHYNKPLPQVINPGEVWSARILESALDNLYQSGHYPKLQVTAVCTTKPLLVRFPPLRPTNK